MIGLFPPREKLINLNPQQCVTYLIETACDFLFFFLLTEPNAKLKAGRFEILSELCWAERSIAGIRGLS